MDRQVETGTLPRTLGHEGDGKCLRQSLTKGSQLFYAYTSVAVGSGEVGVASEEGYIFLDHLGGNRVDVGEVNGGPRSREGYMHLGPSEGNNR